MAIGYDTFPAFAVIHRKCLSFCLSSEKIFSENDNRSPDASYNNKNLGVNLQQKTGQFIKPLIDL